MNSPAYGHQELNTGNPDSSTQDLVTNEDRLPPAFVITKSTDSLEIFGVNYLNELFKTAMQTGVSDVHFETQEVGHICRTRKDGVLTQYKSVLSDHQFSVIREKIYARGAIEESYAKNHAVDSRGWLKFGTRLDLRISSIPTIHGFTIVIRLLDQSNSGRKLAAIEMLQSVNDSIVETLKSPHGLILITGPTGSGKTTTLYSFLNELNSQKVKIFTIENPVEYAIPGVQHINTGIGISFAQALRSALRQDPDIILVGEIRDPETAKIAVEAAQTGHLVLSTLHTNSSVGAISRLMELGVDSSHINETLLAVLAQRLVRRCRDERNVDEPTSEHQEWLRKNGYAGLVRKHFGRGDNRDFYLGRLPVVEMLLLTDEIRAKITLNQVSDVYDLAKKQTQYETLSQAAVRLAMEGKTSLDEAIGISNVSSVMKLDGMLSGEALVALGYLTQHQLEYAREYQQSVAAPLRKTLTEILLDLHFCSIEQINEVREVPDA